MANFTPEERKAMSEKVKNTIGQDPLGRWDVLWKQQVTPWDAGQEQPALKDLILNSGIDFPRSGRALVPGCGRGYDAILISQSLGLTTTAIDISPTAVENANKLLSEDPNVRKDSVIFKEAEFFTYKVEDSEKYDFVYDYTFFVAIEPSRRPDWGRQMGNLVKPGGYLITLIFPIDPPAERGPPHFVRPEHYVEVLQEQCWEKVLDKIPDVSLESHAGRERIVVWKRK